MSNQPAKKMPAWFVSIFVLAAFVMLSLASGEVYYRIILQDRIVAAIAATNYRNP